MASWAPTNTPSTPTGGGFDFSQFMNSPGGQSLVQTLLGGIGNMAQNQRQDQMISNQMTSNAATNQAQLAIGANQGVMNNDLQRQLALTNASPTGWDQQYEQQQLLRNIMLQKLMNPTQGYLPQQLQDRLGTAGQPFKPTLPAEWAQANPFGVDSTMQSLAQRQGVLDLLSQGKGPGMDFTQNGYQNVDPTKAQALQDKTQQYRQYAGNEGNNQLVNLQNAINLSRNATMQNQGGGSSGGSKAMGALGGAAMGAKIGAMGGPIGMGIGAAAGGLIGLFGGGGGGGSNNAQPLPEYRFATPNQNPYAGYPGANGQPGISTPGQNLPQMPSLQDILNQFKNGGHGSPMTGISNRAQALRNAPPQYSYLGQ